MLGTVNQTALKMAVAMMSAAVGSLSVIALSAIGEAC